MECLAEARTGKKSSDQPDIRRRHARLRDLREHYEEPGNPNGPYSGTSYSAYSRDDGKWHQMYIDTNGNVTWFSGELDAHDMAMEAPGAKNSLRKMVYHPLPDGSVEQIGTVSTDYGRHWKPGYDYIYRKE